MNSATAIDLSEVEGKNYYLLKDGFTCRANAPNKPKIRSWKNRIQILNGKIAIWGTICNDYPELLGFSEGLKFSTDRTTLIFQSEKYLYQATPPELCDDGSWCPVDETKD